MYSGDEQYDDDITSGPLGPDNDPKFEPIAGVGFNGKPERFVSDGAGGVVVENPGAIWHLTTLRHAIRLEGMGMRHSSGRSALKHAKDLYGFKGNRAKVLEQLEAKLEELKRF